VPPSGVASGSDHDAVRPGIAQNFSGAFLILRPDCSPPALLRFDDMQQDDETRESTESGDAATRIRERVRTVQERTSELHRTLDSVQEALEKAKGDLKTGRDQA